MRAIKIDALSNGAHRNQDGVDILPDGWAVVPEGMALENFPFGSVTVEEVDGIPTVTGWTPGTMPAPEPDPEPDTPTDDTLEARVAALEADAEQAALDRAALAILLTGEETV